MSGVQSESGEFGVHILVDDQATLDAALASVSGGETIIMRAGEYDSIKLRNQEFTSTVNIVSEDDDNPAVLTGVIDIKSISGLSISGVDLIGGAPLGVYGTRIRLYDSSDVNFSDMKLTGTIRDTSVNPADTTLTTDEALQGAPAEWGFRIERSSGITVDNLDISVFERGIFFTDSHDLKFTNNEIHDLRSDGINVGASNNVLIEGNYFHDFHPWRGNSTTGGDHPDFIQYYAAAGKTITNLTIHENILRQGEGDFVQAIFGHMGNSSTPEPLYTGFDISDNFIQTNHTHGITLNDIADSRIANNVLIPSGMPIRNDAYGWRPMINIGPGSEEYPSQNIEIIENLITLGWKPNFNPSGLEEEEAAARGIEDIENVVLDQAGKVGVEWALMELPDPADFPDYASWKKAALVAIGVEAPEAEPEDPPAPELPPQTGDLPPAELPEDPPAPVVEEEPVPEEIPLTRQIEIGGGDIADLDFSNGDSLIFRGDPATPITSLDDLFQLARRDDVRLDIPDGSGFRLVIDGEDGRETVNISLAGEDGASREVSDAMSADRGLIRNDEARHFDVLANDALGENAMIIGHAESAMGARVETDGESLIYQAMNTDDPGIHLDTIRYAVTDGEGGFGVNEMTVRIVNKTEVTEKGGMRADRIVTSGDDDVIAAKAGRDVVRSGGGDDWLKGGRGHDRLIAGDGDDILQGGRGRDLLDGGRGSDLMIGGRGGDEFRFIARNIADGDRDTIADLNFAAGDTLNFTQFDRGTFSGQEFRAKAAGRAVEIDNMDDLMAMDNVEGVSLTRLGDTRLRMSIDVGGGETGEIDLHFAGKSVAAFDEFWAEM